MRPGIKSQKEILDFFFKDQMKTGTPFETLDNFLCDLQKLNTNTICRI